MRYLIDGKLIRSENAAKSHLQKSKHVSQYLKSRDKCDKVMDIGCGKLRYSDELISIGREVTFVDSVLQLSRKQVVRGSVGSVTDYISKNYPKSKYLAFENILIGKFETRFNFISCTNVLSAIPCPDYLGKVLDVVRSALHDDAEALFVNQHRCSSFSKFKAGQRHMYGYIYEGRAGFSYYGIMKNSVVVELLESQKFEIVKCWTEDDVGFVLARRQKTP